MLSMPAPFFTIIMPNYKTEMYLEEALMSVRSQTYVDFECILVNDGSPGLNIEEIEVYSKDTDFKNSVDIRGLLGAEQWKAIYDNVVENDSRFRFFDKENGGQGSARNLALDHARGEFVVFLDCDDAYALDHLEKLHGYLMAQSSRWADTLFTFGDVKEFGVEGGVKVYRQTPMIEQVAAHPTYRTYLVLNETGLSCCTVHRDLLGDLRFTWLTKSMEDVEIVYRLGAKILTDGQKLNFVRLPVDTVHRRLHDGSITFADAQNGFEKEKVDKIAAYKNLLSIHDLPWVESWLCRLGVWRFEISGRYGGIGKIAKKILTLKAKIISGWYI